MSKHMQERTEQWQQIEESLGGRLEGGRECPPLLEILRLAQADAVRPVQAEAEGQEGHHDVPAAETKTIRDHVAVCCVCGITFKGALKAAKRELQDAPVEAGSASRLLPEETLNSLGAHPVGAAAFRCPPEEFDVRRVHHGDDRGWVRVRSRIRGASIRVWQTLRDPPQWTHAAVIVLGIGMIAYLAAGVASVNARNIQQANTIRLLQAELEQVIAASRITRAAVLSHIQVVNRNQIEVAGEYNPSFIKEVRVRWGTEQDDTWTRIYSGERPDSESRNVSFSKRSPEYKLSGDPIAVTLQFVPYPEIQASKELAFFFRPDQLQHTLTFVLARDGIKAAPDLVTILEPEDKAEVERFGAVAGRINTKEGWPVVLVKPLVGGANEVWWPGPPVDQVVDGQFTTSAYFGNEDTPSKTRFRVVIVLAKSRQEAEKSFEPGRTLRALPAGLPHSKLITVIRE